jgi:hypothetical protein
MDDRITDKPPETPSDTTDKPPGPEPWGDQPPLERPGGFRLPVVRHSDRGLFDRIGDTVFLAWSLLILLGVMVGCCWMMWRSVLEYLAE